MDASRTTRPDYRIRGYGSCGGIDFFMFIDFSNLISSFALFILRLSCVPNDWLIVP